MNDQTKPGRLLSLLGRRKIVASVLLMLAVFLVCELGARVLFAFIVGPRVMAYGTPLFRDATSLPSKVMVKVGYTPPTPENPLGPYAKFAPHELKFDRDQLAFLMHAELMAAVETWCLTRGVPLVDARGALDGERSALLPYVHLSPRGNQVIARALADKILELLP